MSCAPRINQLSNNELFWLRFCFSIFILLIPLLVGCGSDSHAERERQGRVVLKYWDKWNGFEAEAMRGVVEDFNKSQDRIWVDFNSVSQIDRRLMLATAGGVPPDIAGVWGYSVPVYAENNALMPLDELAREKGIRAGDYIPAYWTLCNHVGHLWGLPSTPTTIALVYNKKLFREAGLDPDRPPQTIAELEEYNAKLTRRGADGRIERIGFLPEEPGWWNALWGYWWGADLVDGSKITARAPENTAAYEWLQTYPDRFGADKLVSFRDGFGNFASPQNPFFTGRVAMVLQGVWIFNFIKNYAPSDFEWGVAPFPSSGSGARDAVTLAECDMLVIPSGAKHPREAFEFIAYVNSQPVMERLCRGQLKFSPLAVCSDEFLDSHPHPHIREFLALAKSPNAKGYPRTAIWTSYEADMRNAVSRIWGGSATAGEALDDVQARQQKNLDRRIERWKRMEPALQKLWSKQ